MAGSTSVVMAALIANGAIAVLKFFGFLLTGSPSMLSETYHSISDTGNQVFLLIGIRYSGREPDQHHPFGYGKAQFFYSFLVSVLLFGIAGWESLKHGYEKIAHPGHGAESGGVVDFFGLFSFDPSTFPVDPLWVNVAVLVGAILFESYAFKKANDELRRQIERYDWDGLRDAFRQTSDVTTLTAFTEDAIALGGAAIALVGILLAEFTGNEIYDAVAAALIGLLLMGFAVALAWENKRLLLGESLPADVESSLRGEIRNHEGVVHVDGFRTMFIGANRVLVAADVSFDRGLDTDDLDADIDQIERKLREVDSRVRMVYIEPEV
ncbi:cation diffusion facilitator family transporter [Halobium palmae]|uniref:Cation diffusion facilitator family transporter n=1 Tax=Halobium palmae TaxID=1776492 RepID=A0ABD5RWS4_9EURY